MVIRWKEESLSSPSHSRQELVKRDRQVADTDACGVIDGVGDGSGGANDPHLADPLCAPRADVRIVLVHPRPIDSPDIGVCRDVVACQILVCGVAGTSIHAALPQPSPPKPRPPPT